MKIHVWNAFASNNSGSYTIVGRFEKEELAAQAAAELKEVLDAHGVWWEKAYSAMKEHERPSPLDVFIQKHGLTGGENIGVWDDWPSFSGRKPAPDVWAIGHQVFVHHDFTISLPRTIGEFIYAREGRVETELDHAHHPIVSIFEFWKGEHGQEETEKLLAALVDELNAEDGPLVTGIDWNVLPAWKAGHGFGEPVLRMGAAFEDLPAGFTAVERIARGHNLYLAVKVFEAWPDADPLAFLRPSQPPLKRERFDVWLTALGDKPEDVKRLLRDQRPLTYEEVCALQGAEPIAACKWRLRGKAEELASQLRQAGASVEVRPSTVT
ncbi:hypothetical protein ACN28E_02085 [Archangium lansingense]|uniref:hypothetical protein n=1 Tax=Archangium lansingense TaxID=2995310 RepID=UPI003B815707